jgi:addiction module HigA family antidote
MAKTSKTWIKSKYIAGFATLGMIRAMSNYQEYRDTVAFHPGYYLKEAIDESGLTQADFAKRLDTTPKDLSLLMSGDLQLSAEVATKLSKLLGTSAEYWLNLQNAYDALMAEVR